MFFLVDAKLVLMQPTADSTGALKYDMRIIANDVEFFSFIRDSIPPAEQLRVDSAPAKQARTGIPSVLGLLDSLWFFDGRKVQFWPDVSDLLQAAAATEGNKDLPKPVAVTIDYYPTSIALDKGVIVGFESELIQRRDLPFAYWQYSQRVRLWNYFQAMTDFV